MIAEQRFRADLFYRLSIFPITLPPLRDRREHVPLLVRHFVEQYSQRLKRRIEVIPHSAMDALKRYSLPGNVRQLQNFIERAVILTCGLTLDPLLSELQCVDDKINPEPRRLEDAGRFHILRILEETNGRLAPAAELLGLPRTTCSTKFAGWVFMAMGTRKSRERQEPLWYGTELPAAPGHPFYTRA